MHDTCALVLAVLALLEGTAAGQEPLRRDWRDPGRLAAIVAEVVPLVEQVSGLAFRNVPAVRCPADDDWDAIVRREMPDARDADRTAALTLGLFLLPAGEVVLSPYAGIQLFDARPERSIWGRAVLAHELTHALAEEHFRLPARQRAETDRLRKEFIRALSEGFSVLVELRVADALGQVGYGPELFRGHERNGRVAYTRGFAYLRNLEAEHGRAAMWAALAGEPPSSRKFLTTAARKHLPLRAAAPDGRLVAVADDLKLQVRAPDGDTLRHEWHMGAPARQVSFLPDGRLVAVGSDGALRVFDAVGDGGTRTVFCEAVAFSFEDGRGSARARDGSSVALAAADLAPGRGASVDLRPWLARLGLRPRAQGARGACSVFAAAGAYEFALSRAAGRGIQLSVEFLNWAANDVAGHAVDGSFFHEAVAGFDRHGACREELLPYAATFDAALVPLAEARDDAVAWRDRGCVVHWIRRWQPKGGLQPQHLDAIRSVLARGWPVCLGAAHSTLAVGYRDDPAAPGGGVVLVRDSATGNHAELAYEHVLRSTNDAFWVELSVW